jgi:hypothetical protein
MFWLAWMIGPRPSVVDVLWSMAAETLSASCW